MAQIKIPRHLTRGHIREFEQHILNDHDFHDLADCIQALRALSWAAGFAGLEARTAFVWFESLAEFGPAIQGLEMLADSASNNASRQWLHTLARLYAHVHDALAAGPRRPAEPDVVRRYTAGEIGARTARYVMGWDAEGLYDACRRHGRPVWKALADHSA